ncbi:Seipin-1 [Sesamum alatum]|uniref:Seipin-1 n=1 Tax=Sesamum alatum TaxID=300844 RepID=A0AAE1YNJ4_9LAMI|nr:Seipin-1 [Sesamum alatum]
MDSEEVDHNYKLPTFLTPFLFCTKLLSLQAEIISTCIVSLASPFFSIISLVSDLFRRPQSQESTTKEDSFQPDAAPVPSTVDGGGGGSLLLGRIAMGLLAAAYVCMVLIIVMVVAAVLGVGLVRMWVEKPVYVRESLQFDYTDAHPTALFSFGGLKAAGGAVPVGQTLYVSLLLLMPDSDYNRDVGIFQLTAELISSGGELVARSSHPCMLQFSSWPIRLMRTFLMGVPLLLGISTETQTLTFPILKHKEVSYPRTEVVRITLIPRAGTSSLPQFYDAELLVKSRLPWMKELVYRWKWTFYVWTTMYIFIILVMVLVFFLKPVIFPVLAAPAVKVEQDSAVVELAPQETSVRAREEREVLESLRRWQRSRNKRKAALLHGASSERVSPSAPGISLTHDVGFEEGSGDSESVCFRG